MPFPGNPAGQTPANTFSPTSTPEANDLNSATYTFNATDNQWSTRDVIPTPPAADTAIETPSITGPTGTIDPNTDTTITSSAYTAAEGNPGDHKSSSWQIFEGDDPLVSTNVITAIADVSSSYTEVIAQPAVTISTNTGCGTPVEPNYNTDKMLADFAKDADGTWLYGFSETSTRNAMSGSNSAIFSDDNGATWSKVAGMPSPTQDSAVRYLYYGAGQYFVLFDYSCHSNNNGCDCASNMPGSNSNAGSGWQFFKSDTLQNGSWTECPTSNAGNSGMSYRGSFGKYHYILGYTLSRYMKNDTTSWTSWWPADWNLNTAASPRYSIYSRNGGSTDTTHPGFIFCTGSGPMQISINEHVDGDPDQWVNLTDTFIAIGWPTNANIQDVRWISSMNLYLAVGSGASMIATSPDGKVWTAIDLEDAGETLPAAWDYSTIVTDGNIVHIRGRLGDNAAHFYSADLQTWAMVPEEDDGSDFRPIGYDANFGGWYQWLNEDNGDGTWKIYRRLVTPGELPMDTTRLSIQGAQTDGFDPGMAVISRSGLAAQGSILQLDDNTVELIGVGGVWQIGSKIQTDPRDYTIILESMGNETDLTSILLNNDRLSPASTYRARVQYRSNSNVTSLWSAFGQFNTN